MGFLDRLFQDDNVTVRGHGGAVLRAGMSVRKHNEKIGFHGGVYYEPHRITNVYHKEGKIEIDGMEDGGMEVVPAKDYVPVDKGRRR